MRPRCFLRGLVALVLGAVIGAAAMFASASSQGAGMLRAASEWYSSSPDMRAGICSATGTEGIDTVAETLALIGRNDNERAWRMILEVEC